MEGVVNRYIHLVHLEAKVSFGTFKEQAGGQDLRGPLCISIGIFSTIPYTCMWWYNWYNYQWYNYMWCYNCYNWYQWKTLLLLCLTVFIFFNFLAIWPLGFFFFKKFSFIIKYYSIGLIQVLFYRVINFPAVSYWIFCFQQSWFIAIEDSKCVILSIFQN